MQDTHAHVQTPDLPCMATFFGAIGLMLASGPLVYWSVEALFRLFN